MVSQLGGACMSSWSNCCGLSSSERSLRDRPGRGVRDRRQALAAKARVAAIFGAMIRKTAVRYLECFFAIVLITIATA